MVDQLPIPDEKPKALSPGAKELLSKYARVPEDEMQDHLQNTVSHNSHLPEPS